MSIFYKVAVLAIINALLASNLMAQGVTSDELKNQTIIEENVPEKTDAKVTLVKDKSFDQTPGDAAMLFHIPGLTLTDAGGPLARSQIRFHGLSDARYFVDLEGLSLNNSIHGISDANAMFLFAASHLTTTAQSLSINLPTVDKPMAKGVIGYGSQNTFKVGTSAGTPLDRYSTIFTAMQISGTNGRFSYSSPDLNSRDESNHFTRENNDQNRLQAIVKYQRQTPTNGAHALLVFNGHEGGVAGYAFSPTTTMRSKSVFSGLKVGASQVINKAEFSVDVANSVFDYSTIDDGSYNRLIASSHELTIGFKRLFLPKWLDMDLAQKLIIERAYQMNKTRIGGGFVLNRTSTFGGRMKPTVKATMSFLGFHRLGLMRNKDLSITIEPRENISLTAHLKYSNRLPTFMEMYANNNFFIGNEDLTEEGIWDIDFSSNMRFGQFTRLYANIFMGFISDSIVYVPFLSTRMRPRNTGSARRYGVDLALSIEPFKWLLFETKNSLINSRIKETNAPLPQTPFFLGVTKLRFGTEEFLSLTLQSRYQGAASANIYGTLYTKPYALVDAIVAARIVDHIGLSLSASNIFNVKTARDTYEIPLPGAVIFGQIEIGNIL